MKWRCKDASSNTLDVRSSDGLAGVADTVDFFWHLGDVGYADDALLHEPLTWAYEAAWDEYMDQACGAFASRAPYMVLPGNHEAECHSPACVAEYASRALKLSNFSAYNARFRMPSSESGGSASMWYSFDVGPLHVVALSTESDFPGAPDVCHVPGASCGGFCDALGCGDWRPWLEADLKSVNRSATPWVVVGGHRPLYSLRTVDADDDPGHGRRGHRGRPAVPVAAVQSGSGPAHGRGRPQPPSFIAITPPLTTRGLGDDLRVAGPAEPPPRRTDC